MKFKLDKVPKKNVLRHLVERNTVDFKEFGRDIMRGLMIGIAFVMAIFQGCKQKNLVYSNVTLNQAYKFDPTYNYKGYDPQASEKYLRYNPKREDKIIEELYAKETFGGRDSLESN